MQSLKINRLQNVSNLHIIWSIFVIAECWSYYLTLLWCWYNIKQLTTRLHITVTYNEQKSKIKRNKYLTQVTWRVSVTTRIRHTHSQKTGKPNNWISIGASQADDQNKTAKLGNSHPRPRETPWYNQLLQKVMLIYNRLVSMIVFILWEQVNQRA